MITSYARGNVKLTVDCPVNSTLATFTLERSAVLTADEVQRVNRELGECSAAQLLPSGDDDIWEIRSGTEVLASDHGEATKVLTWVEQAL